MNRLNDIRPADSNLRALNTGTLIDLLLRRSLAHLSKGELRHIAENGPEIASALAQNAATVAEGLGLLITCDNESWAGETAGSFRDRDELGQLLFHLSDLLNTVQAVSRAAVEASRAMETASQLEAAYRS